MSPDIRRLLDNLFSLGVLKIYNVIFPLLTLPYLIDTLTVKVYGVIVLTLSISMYFQTLIDYGFNLSATREISRHRGSNVKLQVIYSRVLLSKVILLSISLLVLYPAISLLPDYSVFYKTYWCIGLILVGYSLFPEWFFRGIERMRYLAVLDFLIKLCFTVAVFVFIKSEGDVWLYPLMLGMSYIIVSLILHFFVVFTFGVKFRVLKLGRVILNLKGTFPLFLNQFLPNFYNNTTVFLVGIILGSLAVGIFGAAKQVVVVLNVFNSVVSSVMYPYLNRNKKYFLCYAKLYLGLLFSLSLFFIIVANFILEFMDIHHHNSEVILSLLVFGVFGVGVSSVFSTNYLLTYKRDKLVMKITFFASMTGFLFAYPLISGLGLVGAALNVFLCQCALGVGSFIFYRKVRRELEGKNARGEYV